MSFELVKWAYEQEVKPASTKFVLVTMAVLSNPLFYASIGRLVSMTGLNQKTVEKAIQQLKSQRYIEATGRKKGKTGKVCEYLLSTDLSPNAPKSGGIVSEQTTKVIHKYPQKVQINTPNLGGQICIDNKHLTRAPVDPVAPVDNSVACIDKMKTVLQ